MVPTEQIQQKQNTIQTVLLPSQPPNLDCISSIVQTTKNYTRLSELYGIVHVYSSSVLSAPDMTGKFLLRFIEIIAFAFVPSCEFQSFVLIISSAWRHGKTNTFLRIWYNLQNYTALYNCTFLGIWKSMQDKQAIMRKKCLLLFHKISL